MTAAEPARDRAQYIRQVVDAAPPLGPKQRATLLAIFGAAIPQSAEAPAAAGPDIPPSGAARARRRPAGASASRSVGAA